MSTISATSVASNGSTVVGEHESMLADADHVDRSLSQAQAGELNQKEMKEVLGHAQMLLADLRGAVRKLQAKNAALELSKGARARDKSHVKLKDRICKLAKTFCVIYDPFPDGTAFNPEFARPDFDPTRPDRYLNANKDFGYLAELYVHVDPDLHPLMIEADEFGDTFLKEINQQRSHLINRIRSSGHKVFTQVPQMLFAVKSSNDRLDATAIKKVIGITSADQFKSAKFPAFFFRVVGDWTTLFLGAPLLSIVLIAIYGPEAAFSEKRALRANSPFFRKRVITPGLIAFAATIGRFILSSDPELPAEGLGGKTNVDYSAAFDEYKELIIKASVDNRDWYTELVNTWKSVVFPSPEAVSVEREDTQEVPDSDPESGLTIADALARMKRASAAKSQETEASTSDTPSTTATPPLPNPSSISVRSSLSYVATEPPSPGVDWSFRADSPAVDSQPVDLPTNSVVAASDEVALAAPPAATRRRTRAHGGSGM